MTEQTEQAALSAPVKTNELSLNIKNFNGPLDLLLHLVKEAKIEIKDIFLSEVTSQFLAYMTQLNTLDVDKASEYMEIAATLLEIKSHSLLPVMPGLEDDSAETSEQLLIRRLEEYAKLFKEASMELKELENQVLTAKDRLTALEYQIFTQLREYLAKQAARVQQTAAAVAAADTLCSLAAVAVQRGYCRPEITLGREITIENGRHPVVEAMLKDSLFVPNDTHLGAEDNQVSIITGPNMAGKSTYMRQVALIVLMAQMGSFVPARSAKIGLVDRVFTRIGASDDLASGQSTFMVEMAEVATILKYATSRSLLILDEIGRGTSTYDGMAIARAVLEYAANPKRLGAKTLFATHYHELSTLEDKLPNVKNYNIAVKKRGEQMIFLRKIVPGATDDSYGIEVAKLAGIPAPVITRAREILAELESEGVVTAPAAQKEPEDQVSMMDLTSQQVVAALSAISVETLTPIEAMNELYKLKKMLD